MDNEQFAKYEERGAYHWRRTIALPKHRSYNPILHSRYQWAAEHILRAIRISDGPFRILDVGCGDGVLFGHLPGGNLACYGLDTEFEALHITRTMCSLYHSIAPKLTQGSAAKLPYRGDSFDIVVALEVLEHLDAYQEFIREIYRVLKPGGCLLLSTPNRERQRPVPDEYHVQEFIDAELLDLVDDFASVECTARHPEVLYRVYRGGSPLRLLNRIGKHALKGWCRFVSNVFARIHTHKPSSNWRQLTIVARK